MAVGVRGLNPKVALFFARPGEQSPASTNGVGCSPPTTSPPPPKFRAASHTGLPGFLLWLVVFQHRNSQQRVWGLGMVSSPPVGTSRILAGTHRPVIPQSVPYFSDGFNYMESYRIR